MAKQLLQAPFTTLENVLPSGRFVHSDVPASSLNRARNIKVESLSQLPLPSLRPTRDPLLQVISPHCPVLSSLCRYQKFKSKKFGLHLISVDSGWQQSA